MNYTTWVIKSHLHGIHFNDNMIKLPHLSFFPCNSFIMINLAIVSWKMKIWATVKESSNGRKWAQKGAFYKSVSKTVAILIQI